MRWLTPVSRISSSLLSVFLCKQSACKSQALGPIGWVAQHNEGKLAAFQIKGCYLSTSLLGEDLHEYEKDQYDGERVVLEKNANLQLALSHMVADFDRESNLSMCRFFSLRRAPVISTGSLKLDQALGIGGLPKGRMVEIYGKEASGKTTLALHIVKEAQKLGGCCAYLDVENAMEPSLAEAMGVNTENLLFARPSCAEKTLSIVNTLVNSASVDVIVVDSVAALVSECELNSMIDIESHDVQPRLMTQALRKIQHSLYRSQALVIFVNQVRKSTKPSKGFSDGNEFTCGGSALRFYAAVRMRIMRKELLHFQDKITGISIAVQIMKNKMAPALKKADLEIEFGRGFCREAEIFLAALEHGFIMKEGNGYWIEGKFLKGQREAETYLAENSDVTDQLTNCLRNQLFFRAQDG
ncbi:hypothetical protein HPP92_001489 [Vanilla planifolia]|uniref:Uncharacterized protein n=1 Tax=Vanilla planifolia TaxID=51239 RepID=A0A835SC18_VANPL|nr:hypothetical protein HPP92_001489 [Vanilla planifolia]